MNKIQLSEIAKIFDSHTSIDELKANLDEYYKMRSEVRTILGFDIYKYSKYKHLEQSLIPYIFKTLYFQTIDHCLTYEKYLFQKFKGQDEFSSNLIDTGDGGFQIFNNPIEAFVFAVYFQANLRRYNSFGSFENVRNIVGEITLRYALTTDSLFSFENNFYGPCIINNARIMSKDKLNRFLIDESTVRWYDKHIKGFENFQTLEIEDFDKIPYFSEYKRNKEIDTSLIFQEPNNQKLILQADILRIGELQAKGDSFSVYSCHSQIKLHSTSEDGFNRYTVTIGNLNTTGLDCQ
jgi:hypothetical protein